MLRKPALIAILLSFALLPACDISGYGPARDQSSFTSSKATRDSRYGVFSHHRYVYRPATGWRAFPDGGIPAYDEDANTLGVYEFATGRVRIVRREKNEFFQPGQGNFYVTHILNTKAVVSQGGQKRSDYMPGHRQFMLDIPSGKLSSLPIKEELEKLGRAPGYSYLVDDAGTMALVTAPLGEDSRYVSKESNPKELWLRRPGGSYEKAATVVHYYPSTDGLLHFYDFERKEYLVYDMDAHAVRTPPGRYPPSAPDITFDLVKTPDSKDSLCITRKVGDEWVYDEPVVKAPDFD